MSTESTATPAQRIAAGYAVTAKRWTWAPSSSTERPTPTALVSIPLSMFNRHGLVAGATGTGKTKTLQVIAEQLVRGRRAGVHPRRQGRSHRAVRPGRAQRPDHPARGGDR